LSRDQVDGVNVRVVAGDERDVVNDHMTADITTTPQLGGWGSERSS
jgi:hypothetical protein